MNTTLVGFLVDNILTAGNYQSSLWMAMTQAALERNVSLITIVGGALSSGTTDEFEYYRNDIYSLTSSAPLDGVIITGTVGTFQTPQNLLKFHRRFSMPTLTIGTPLTGVPCVSVDNYSGSRRIIEHLLGIHECRRIAFIQGPTGMPEAAARYRAYEEALDRFGIPIDPTLVFHGDFLPQSGVDMVASMSTTQLKSLDAIVAANDNMALGALGALRDRGIEVPNDVIVAGFDDTEESPVSSPPLTTVRQPREQLARTALDLLLRKINGEEAPDLVEIQTELIVRRSCGCRVNPGVQDIELVAGGPAGQDDRPPAIDRNAVVSDVRELLGPSAEHHQVGDAMLDTICATFIDELESTDLSADFGQRMDMLNDYLLRHSDDTQYANRIVSALHKAIFARISDGDLIRHASEMIRTALAKTNQAGLHWAINQRLQLEKVTGRVHAVSRSLMAQFDMRSLLDNVERNLQSFGINNCYLLLRSRLYDENAGEDTYFLMRAFGGCVEGDLDLEREYHFGEVLHMACFGESDVSHLAETLYFRDQIFGFVIVGCHPSQRIAVESLITQVCSALNGWSLFREQERIRRQLQENLGEIEEMNKRLAELSITDELTALYNRRGFIAVGQQQLLVSRRKGDRLLALYIDMDHLKEINDRYGHDAGDDALITLSERLRSTLRDSDIVARLGGDEFTALALETDMTQASVIEAKIHDALADWSRTTDRPYSLSCTIGFAEFDPNSDDDLESLLTMADRELLEKRKVRDR